MDRDTTAWSTRNRSVREWEKSRTDFPQRHGLAVLSTKSGTFGRCMIIIYSGLGENRTEMSSETDVTTYIITRELWYNHWAVVPTKVEHESSTRYNHRERADVPIITSFQVPITMYKWSIWAWRSPNKSI